MLTSLVHLVSYVVPFLLVLTLVVTIHELGHFLAAKAFGVRIDRFSIGFGRAVFARTDRSGVEWRLGWLPLGGYVKFSGDLDETGVPDREGLAVLRREIVAEEGPGAERAFYHFKPIWQRAVIAASGPLANFALAIVLFAVTAMAAGEVLMAVPRIGSVMPNSPAAHAGFRPGDVVVKANWTTIRDFESLRRYVRTRAGEPIRFQVRRGEAIVDLIATPATGSTTEVLFGPPQPVGVLGFTSSGLRSDVYSVRYNPVSAIGEGFRTTGELLGGTANYLRRIVTGRESGDQLSGPLGIARASGAVANGAVEGTTNVAQATSRLAVSLLTLAGLLSVGVGFLNLLPVPVLDGGHLLFYAYEAVARRPLAAGVQAVGYRVGLALLVGLMLFATWNDLQKLSVFKFLGGLAS